MSKTLALLGPTNTGKTTKAIDYLLNHYSGVFGLPLRLLAREVYNKVVLKVASSDVVLITGEERIGNLDARYRICTTEVMYADGCDCVIIDEIQLCYDRDRGHIFSDRLLNCRGLETTIFLGSSAMKSMLQYLVSISKLPPIEFH